MKVLTDLHMSSNQIYNSGFETVKSLPTSDLFKGRIVFYEVDNLYYQYNGTEWIALSGSGGGGTTINGVGEDVSGKSYTIDGTSYTAGTGAEIFNDYTNNKAVGDYSHAEGGGTKAEGTNAHAEGAGTTASGVISHAEGCNTIASGVMSHVEGYGTIASQQYQHVQGRYNKEDTANKYAFIIGNGTSPSSRSNAFAIDWNGLLYKDNNTEGVDITKSVGKNVEGKTYTIDGTEYTAGVYAEIFNNYSGNKAIKQYSHAEGSGTTALGSYSHAEGYNTTASGMCSHAENQSTIASGENSHAEGSGTTASGSYSHAEGRNTTASIICSHAEGQNTTASGENSHAEGCSTTASGKYSHAEGYNTTTEGYGSHSEGQNTTASGSCSHAEGGGTIASQQYQHVQGKYNVEDSENKYAFIIGNGTSDTDRSNAFAIGWDGLIYINNATTGIDLVDLVTKVQALIDTSGT